MDSLRLILLVIGIFFILGIYLWDIFFKSEAKKREDILDAVDELPDLPLYNLKNKDDMDYSSAVADLGSMLNEARYDVPEYPEEKSQVEFSPQMSVKDFEDNVPDDHDFDVFAAVHQEVERQEQSGSVDDNVEEYTEGKNNTDAAVEEQIEPEKLAEKKSLGNVSDDILALFVTSPLNTLFNGLSISKAADQVGMVYGHMNIFHHFGPGKLHSGQPLFSMANMFEPGSFDLGRMADLKTKGIVIFMYSPASIEPGVVFELFLNTTQRIAKMLGGEVRTADNELLNSTKIKLLRDKAESLSAD